MNCSATSVYNIHISFVYIAARDTRCRAENDSRLYIYSSESAFREPSPLPITVISTSAIPARVSSLRGLGCLLLDECLTADRSKLDHRILHSFPASHGLQTDSPKSHRLRSLCRNPGRSYFQSSGGLRIEGKYAQKLSDWNSSRARQLPADYLKRRGVVSL